MTLVAHHFFPLRAHATQDAFLGAVHPASDSATASAVALPRHRNKFTHGGEA